MFIIILKLFVNPFESWKSKGAYELKARLDYCEDPARSCEKFNTCFPAQTKPKNFFNPQKVFDTGFLTSIQGCKKSLDVF